MDLRQILAALRARYGVALLVTLLVAGAVLGITATLPKKYTATTSLVVDIKLAQPMSALLLPGSMATQVAIIQSDRVAQRAAKLLKLDENPTLREQWMTATEGKSDMLAWVGHRLETGLFVKPGDASVVEINYSSTDAAFAAAAANAYAQAYVDTLVALRAGPAAQYARGFSEQTSALRAELEKAQARLLAYQKRTGIVVTDDKLDAETAKLSQLTTQLVAVEGQVADAGSRQQTGSAAASLPGAAAGDGALQQLRSQIDQKEVQLREAGEYLGVNHPKYRAMQAELDELKQKLATETSRVTSGFSVAKSVGRRTEAALRAAIEAQKNKILDMRSKRDEIDLLKGEVDRAQVAYDAVAKRLTQTSLDSQATEANVTVLSPAVTPIEPSFPKPFPVMATIAAVLGVVAGIGVALLLEAVDRRVRGAEDLATMLQLPVLGVIENSRKRRQLLPRQRPVPLLR
jgi:succinoglycan biosynthesis transport protein ExoP